MELKELIDVARKHGWTVTKARRRNHLKFVSPDKDVPMIHAAATPSDHRAVKNIRAWLRKAGLDV